MGQLGLFQDEDQVFNPVYSVTSQYTQLVPFMTKEDGADVGTHTPDSPVGSPMIFSVKVL